MLPIKAKAVSCPVCGEPFKFGYSCDAEAPAWRAMVCENELCSVIEWIPSRWLKFISHEAAVQFWRDDAFSAKPFEL
jgi:hypothetical protein